MLLCKRIAMISTCFAAVAAFSADGDQAVGSHVLFDFETGAEGWKANVYGKGKMWAEAAAEAKVGRGAFLVHFRELSGANLIGPAIPFGQAWRQRRYDRVRFWARAERPMSKACLVFVTDEAKHATYNLHFPMEKTGWQRHTYPLARCWNRGKKALDATRITRVYVTGAGTLDFALDHVELLEAAREVYLKPDRHVFVRPAESAPKIDGQLSDAAWQGATHLPEFVQYKTGTSPKDQTEAWVTFDDEALYVAAQLYTRDPSKLKAEETARDASVWRDDCFEVFIDPQHTHTECYQFVTNAIGSQLDIALPGGKEGRGKSWNGSWIVKTAVGTDSWVVEMRIPFSDFGLKPEIGGSWGFNVCREAPSTGELSYWTDTGGRFTRVRGLADLVFGRPAEDGIAVTNVRLEEKAPGSYILRAETKALAEREASYVIWTQSPDDARTRARGEASIAAGEGEIALPVEFEAKEEGEAKVWFVLKDKGTQSVITYGAYNFQIAFPSEASLANLVLVPRPKEMQRADGAFELKGSTIIHIGDDPDEGNVGDLIQRETAECYGVTMAVRRHGDIPSENVVLVGRPDTNPALKQALTERDLLGRLDGLKPEGYMLVVEPERILAAGRDDRGTYYAARTLLQLVANAASEGDAPRAPCSTIVDWPDFPFRGFMVHTSGWPQDPIDVEMVKEFIYKQVAGGKFNTIVWQMKAGYQYSRWPRLRNRCALSREQVRDVARFARDHFVEIIPNTNILGHSNWIVLKYKELQEDGKQHQLCTRHPMTYPLLFDVMEEMLDVFDQPKRLHVGLDEVRWKTFNLPEDQRCDRCRGVPKWQIFADHITKLRDFLKSKGVEMWMWGDMLLTRHNGGPPFDCHKALDLIPKDIVICNWSAEYARGSSKELVDKGFRVVKANSRQVPLDDAPYVFGNLASYWYRHPWCPVTSGGERGLMMQTAYGADFSWNINRESVSQQQWVREQDVNVLRMVAQPRVPHGKAQYEPVDIAAWVNRSVVDETPSDGKGWADLGPEKDLRSLPAGSLRVGNIDFRTTRGNTGEPWAAHLTAQSPAAGPLQLKLRAESVAFLHAGIFPTDPDRRKAYLKRFLAPCVGVPVATVRVTYAGGKQVSVPLRVGMEVGSWRPTRHGEYLYRCPYILRLATEECRRKTPGATDTVLYAYEWVNPHPSWRIDAMAIGHAGVEADYALLAVSTRGRR